MFPPSENLLLLLSLAFRGQDVQGERRKSAHVIHLSLERTPLIDRELNSSIILNDYVL